MLLSSMKIAFAITILPFLFASFVFPILVSADLLSQQCLREPFILSANLTCSQSGTADHVSTIGRQQHPVFVNPLSENNVTSDFAPWSYKPACTELLEDLHSELCVYTDTMFGAGRGISIFTTPQIAHEVVTLLPFQEPGVLDGINEPEGPWYAQKLPGKGIGLLAKRNLARGDLVSAYTPVLLAYMDRVLSVQQREKFLRIAIDQLPAATKESYLSLATIFGDPAVIVQDVIKANAFEMQVGGQMHLALVPEPSRINHDCAPNAQYYLKPSLLAHYVHAARPISLDEELTISYSSPLDPHQTRQQYLFDAFHFACKCPRCLAGDSSDAVLKEMKLLQETLGDWTLRSSATPEKAERLIRLYEQEGLEGFLDTAYVNAALTYNAVGDAKEAMRYAALAADAVALKDGPEAPALRDCKNVVDNPRAHWSWRRRKRG